MKAIIICMILLGSDKGLIVYRELLIQSEKNSIVAEKFYKNMRNLKPGSQRPVFAGYKAMSSFMMSKHVANPFTKLNYFKEGKTTLEEAIERDTASAELAYLRFLIQSTVPAFLNYNSDMVKDKKKLLRFIKKDRDDMDLKTRIYNFIVRSPKLTSEEKNEVKSDMNSIK